MGARYVWGRYSAVQQIGYRTRYRETTSNAGTFYTVNLGGSSTVQISSGYSFSTTSGTFSRTGIKSYDTFYTSKYLAGGYVALTGNKLAYCSNWFLNASKNLSSYNENAILYSAESYQQSYTYYVQGSFIQYVSNANSGQYPSNSDSGGYYYVLQGSDNVDPNLYW